MLDFHIYLVNVLDSVIIQHRSPCIQFFRHSWLIYRFCCLYFLIFIQKRIFHLFYFSKNRLLFTCYILFAVALVGVIIFWWSILSCPSISYRTPFPWSSWICWSFYFKIVRAWWFIIILPTVRLFRILSSGSVILFSEFIDNLTRSGKLGWIIRVVIFT